jgi:hypothetical protein
VTIALGFHCPDGIVLCSDTQITNEAAFKYYEPKIFPIESGPDTGPWAVVLTYAGNTEQMKLVYERLRPELYTSGQVPTLKFVREAYEAVLAKAYKQFKSRFNLATLCAISIPGERNLLLVSKNDLVRESSAECLGVGDSSLIKYLTAFLLPLIFSTNHATLAGSYIVKQAKAYVDGCGGDTLTVALSNGIVSPVHQMEDYSDDIDRAIRRLVLDVSDVPVPDSNFAAALERFCKAMNAAREIG